MNREYRSWWSPRLDREMEFLWFGHQGRPLLMFPTSGGRFWENEDFHLVGSLADKVDRGELQVICADSIDKESWMCGWAHPHGRVRRHDQYDHYLSEELVPYIQWRAGRSDLIVYGASWGAYHAANFALRHPDQVRRAVLFSGIYDTYRVLDGYWDDLCYFHCPTAYLPNMDDWWAEKIRAMDWVVATGEHDHLVGENRHFAGLLASKGVPVHQEIWPGQFGHDWPWWREHLRRFVP
jgi:esterase/lipase superfamily enzyme